MSAKHEDVDNPEEVGSLMGRGAKYEEKSSTPCGVYGEVIRDFMLNIRPHVIPALVLTIVFTVAWTVFYAWGIFIYAHRHVTQVTCMRPLETFLMVEGVIGIICGIFGVVVISQCVCLLYGTRPSVLPAAPNHFIGLITTFLVLSLFHIAWWLVGTAWVFETGNRTTHTGKCDDDLFSFTFWFLTVGWMWYGLLAILACMVPACLPPIKRPEALSA